MEGEWLGRQLVIIRLSGVKTAEDMYTVDTVRLDVVAEALTMRL